MTAYWGSRSIIPRILDFDARLRWMVSLTLRPLYPQGKNPRYSLVWRLGGPQNLSGCGVEKKNSQPLPGLEPRLIQSVAQRYKTEFPRLLPIVFPISEAFLFKFYLGTKLLCGLRPKLYTFHAFLTYVFIIRGCIQKFPGLAAWSENCKLYISLPLGAVVSLFCESV
jgi:hypothetical protein